MRSILRTGLGCPKLYCISRENLGNHCSALLLYVLDHPLYFWKGEVGGECCLKPSVFDAKMEKSFRGWVSFGEAFLKGALSCMKSLFLDVNEVTWCCFRLATGPVPCTLLCK